MRLLQYMRQKVALCENFLSVQYLISSLPIESFLFLYLFLFLSMCVCVCVRAGSLQSGKKAKLLDVGFEVEHCTGMVKRSHPFCIFLRSEVVVIQSLCEHSGFKGIN